MYDTLMALLFYAEYNFEKLKEYWGEPKSPEQALLWRLKGGILKCVGTLLIAEKCFWIKPKTDNRYYSGDRVEKKPPKKLLKALLGIISNSASGQTEREQVEKLKEGIRNVSTYLLNIKTDKNYLNSKVLKNVYEYLQLLLELEPPQITQTTNSEACP